MAMLASELEVETMQPCSPKKTQVVTLLLLLEFGVEARRK
jgi:hypothetical protein